jgi:hypothetical protein
LIPKDDGSNLHKDQTYAQIIKRLEPFMTTLSPEDKAFMSNMVVECYLKYSKSIQSNPGGDYLMASLIMALLTEQNKRIEGMKE